MPVPNMDSILSLRPAFLENVPITLQIIGAGAILALLYTIYIFIAADRPLPGFPIVALTERGLGPKWSWYKAGNATITKGLRENPGAFQIITGTGPKIVLPNRFADELKNRDELNFNKAFAKEFFPEYHGFEGFKQGLQDDTLIQETVRVKLTQSLNLITGDLVDETTAAVHDIFGEDEEWHSTTLNQNILELVTRLSSRVFLGKELCRERRWLDIAKNYTVDAFIAGRLLRAVPPVLRPIMYWFIPHCRRLRAQVRDSRKLIDPEIRRRIERTQKALEAGEKPPKTADTIGWMYEVARGRQVDYVAGQLSLTMAAIHTTTGATTTAIIDLTENPEIVQPLREEAIAVISENGWSKAALQKLKLMDSFLKESQRLHPPGTVSMNRHVERTFTLSDGTTIPAGSRLMVAGSYNDPSVYSDPETFDAFRFANKRQETGQANLWGHVATRAEHMGFGHGQHACPGRFFASNEIKVALVHLLLKYDWKAAVEGEKVKFMGFEANSVVDPKCRVQIRRRREEIDVDLPEA